MKKNLGSIIILLLLILGLVYRHEIYDWLQKYHSRGLAAFSIPSELLNKLGTDSSLLPGPLRGGSDAQSLKLTKAGVIYQTNLQRKNNDRTALTESTALNKAAQLKLNDMFAKQYFEHISPEGKGPSDLADQAGYAYIVVGENLALGNFKGDADLVEAWMNSPGHRENILNQKYLQIGIAVGKGMFEGRETWLAVQEFGMPKSACPGVDENLKKTIDSNQSQINTMAQTLNSMKADLENNKYKTREEYNQAVEQYNAQVNKFNNLITLTKQQVEQYNAQVNNLNSCIKQ